MEVIHKISIVYAIVTQISSLAIHPASKRMESMISNSLSVASEKYNQILLSSQHFQLFTNQPTATILYPRSEVDFKLNVVEASDWTAGFFPGCLWQLYDLTGEKVFLEVR